MAINSSNLRNKVFGYIPGTILPALVGFMTTYIFTRILSPEDYGKLILILNSIVFFTMVIGHWICQSINRYNKQESNEEVIIINQIIVYYIILVSFVVAIIFGFISLTPEYSELKKTIFVSVLLTFIFTIYLSFMQASERSISYSLSTSFNSFLKLCAALVGMILYEKTLKIILISYNIATGIVLFGILYSIRKYFKFTVNCNSKKILKEKMVQFLIYGLPLTLWVMASQILTIADRYIINYYHGSAITGIYTANYSLVVGPLGLLFAPIMLAGHPYLMKKWNDNDISRVIICLSEIITKTLIAAIVMVVFVSIYSLEISTVLLGEGFVEGHIVIPFVLIGFVFWQMSIYSQKPLEFYQKSSLMSGAILIVSLVNILLNCWFLRSGEYIVSAIITMFSYLIYLLFTIVIGRRLLKWYLDVVVIVRFVPYLFVSTFLSLIYHYFARVGMWQGLYVITFAVIVYFVPVSIGVFRLRLFRFT